MLVRVAWIRFKLPGRNEFIESTMDFHFRVGRLGRPPQQPFRFAASLFARLVREPRSLPILIGSEQRGQTMGVFIAGNVTDPFGFVNCSLDI